jgi:hypothetical protein
MANADLHQRSALACLRCNGSAPLDRLPNKISLASVKPTDGMIGVWFELEKMKVNLIPIPDFAGMLERCEARVRGAIMHLARETVTESIAAADRSGGSEAVMALGWKLSRGARMKQRGPRGTEGHDRLGQGRAILSKTAQTKRELRTHFNDQSADRALCERPHRQCAQQRRRLQVRGQQCRRMTIWWNWPVFASSKRAKRKLRQ